MTDREGLARLARRIATGDQPAVPSPCVSVCRMDAASGLCEGCCRTIDEIASWSRLHDEDKREVWRRIGERVSRPAQSEDTRSAE